MDIFVFDNHLFSQFFAPNKSSCSNWHESMVFKSHNQVKHCSHLHRFAPVSCWHSLLFSTADPVTVRLGFYCLPLCRLVLTALLDQGQLFFCSPEYQTLKWSQMHRTATSGELNQWGHFKAGTRPYSTSQVNIKESFFNQSSVPPWRPGPLQWLATKSVSLGECVRIVVYYRWYVTIHLGIQGLSGDMACMYQTYRIWQQYKYILVLTGSRFSF